MKSFALLFASATIAILAACSSDSTTPTPSTNTPDSGTPPAAEAGADTGVQEPVDVGSGTKWSDLYRDIFGPTGRPGSCTFASGCHGSETAAGVTGGGVRCFDEKGCRESFLAQQLVKAADSANPDSASLFSLLRNRDSSGTVRGFMPKEPATFVFPDKSMERVKTWIADGFKDD